ncbi:uncharacterized protein LOC129301771 [Prosopis cineraria]|uniref:uncharacterized protein LOC129301771 n=1 Tax=Prosopis cineraria TaxID=364024 RepID=UPI00240EC7BB|nr:uncharacterized protein LOC129301771 [Prosopis cineraria]XP_054796339.1 uncharacterized protein LOC129301771 [Prosopis cineraria]
MLQLPLRFHRKKKKNEKERERKKIRAACFLLCLPHSLSGADRLAPYLNFLPSFSFPASTMASVSGSVLLRKNSPIHLPFELHLNELDYNRARTKRSRLSLNLNHPGRLQLSSTRRPLKMKIQAAYSNDGRPSSASIFVGGFILGGLIVGTVGCVYAPQISKALAGADRKELMRKLPKFIYDEEKALEKTRRVLAEKIAQLNDAIDDVSAQLRSEEAPNGVAVNSEIETAT